MILTLAWRNVWRNKARSLVIMASIALGLYAGLSVLALYQGMLQSRIRTLIDEETGHIQIHHPRFTEELEAAHYIENPEKVKQVLARLPEVSQINARVVTAGMLSTARGTAGVQVIGCDTLTEFSFSALGRKTEGGARFRSGKRNQAIIGRKLADKMKLRPGSRFVLMFNDSASSLISGAFRVTAIYRSANSALDERLVYVQAGELAGLLAMPGQIHEIGLKLHRDEDVEAQARNLKRLFPGLKTETWKEISPETDFLAKTADTYAYVVVIIIMIALAFGILNTMLMAIMERTREIGMIAALGCSRGRIFGLVLCETVFLTAAGVPAGIFLAWITCAYFSQTGLDLSGMGEEMMSGYGFRTVIYPEFPLKKLVPVLSVVSITALISGFLPAWKAAGMKPADTLKI